MGIETFQMMGVFVQEKQNCVHYSLNNIIRYSLEKREKLFYILARKQFCVLWRKTFIPVRNEYLNTTLKFSLGKFNIYLLRQTHIHQWLRTPSFANIERSSLQMCFKSPRKAVKCIVLALQNHNFNYLYVYNIINIDKMRCSIILITVDIRKCKHNFRSF